MTDLFQRALASTEIATRDGVVSPKEALWLVAAWLCLAAEAVYRLADPTEQVDQAELTDTLTSAWNRVAVLVDGIELPFWAGYGWQAVKTTVPGLIPRVVEALSRFIDAGESHA